MNWHWSRSPKEWVYCGAFCEDHLAGVIKMQGECKISIVATENIELAERCNIVGCKGFVRFLVDRKRF